MVRDMMYTCPYWAESGECNKGSTCVYFHENVGRIAPWPSKNRPSKVTGQWRMPLPITEPFFIQRAEPDWRLGTSSINTHDLRLVFPHLAPEVLSWAIENGVSYETFMKYVQHFDETEVKGLLQSPRQYSSPLFAAVKARRPDVLRFLLACGASSNKTIIPEGIPILGFAIFDAARDPQDTTELVVTLLAAGANPYSIPQHLWTEYIKTPVVMSKPQQENAEQFHEAARWCHSQSFYVELLASQLYITHRYSLYKASKLPRPSPRRIQIARMHEITPLLEVPYHLIGQEHATTMVVEKLIHYFAYQKNKPLVIIFAGLSGHGKTELAKQMGIYLAADHVIIDCTEMRRETDLFGPKAPYIGHEQGSPLNNYLCNTVGKCNLVFLDEFEKTHQEVQQALLSIWQDGDFRDRRNHTKLECTNTIWILATNLGESEILRFHNTYLKGRSKGEEEKAPWKKLEKELKTTFAGSFGKPVTGRISLVIPFVPFSKGEGAVVGHKFILELGKRIRGPIDLSRNNTIGNMDLNLVDDRLVCSYLSKNGYNYMFGARSLQHIIQERIEDEVCRQYLDIEEEITKERNSESNAQITVKLVSSSEGEDVVVSLKG